jgi:hypothetical protein
MMVLVQPMIIGASLHTIRTMMAKRTQNARNQQPRLYLMMLMKKPATLVMAQVVGLIQPAITLVMVIQTLRLALVEKALAIGALVVK